MQSLDGAYKRAERARKHLANLKKRIHIFRQAISDNVAIERKPQIFRRADGREIKGVLGTATVPIKTVPHIISILVGESIYNLRASLDYLIYELAQLDAGRVINRTQFPIEDTEKCFKGRRGRFLEGVNDKHVAIIERLQPYNGCNWTRILRDLSNPDKHRQLTTVSNPVVVSPSAGSTEAIISGEPVNVKDDVSVYITFRDGTPVIETLEQLLSAVRQTLDIFKPEFK